MNHPSGELKKSIKTSVKVYLKKVRTRNYHIVRKDEFKQNICSITHYIVGKLMVCNQVLVRTTVSNSYSGHICALSTTEEGSARS